jgi:type IV secretory pathway VirB10-like protein
MIVRYTHRFFIGALVDKRILIGALAVGAFALTLALSSRQADQRRSDAAPPIRVAVQAQPHEVIATATREAAPTVAAMNSAPAMAPPPEPEQSEPQSEPLPTADSDRDRGADRSARAR